MEQLPAGYVEELPGGRFAIRSDSLKVLHDLNPRLLRLVALVVSARTGKFAVGEGDSPGALLTKIVRSQDDHEVLEH